MSPIVPEDDRQFVVDDPFAPRYDFQARARTKIIVPATTRGERSERDITEQAIDWLKRQPATYAWKLFSGALGESGHPDIDGCSGGRSIKIEMKRPGKKPTPIQMARLRQWREAGAIVGWATSASQVQQLFAYSMAHPAWRNPLTGPGVGTETTRQP